MMPNKVLFKIVLLLSWFLINHAFAALQATVTPRQISLGESARFSIHLENNTNDDVVPNLVPLQKDFEITGTEQNTSYTFINGKSNTIKAWNIYITPKRAGTLTIPQIRVGNEATKPIKIEVSNISSLKKDIGSQKDVVWLDESVSTKTPYINQQVIYTIKLYNKGRVIDARYEPPNVKDALIVPLGEAKRYRETQDNDDYIVEEQKYAIYPQKTGSLIIEGPRFSAVVYEYKPRRITIPSKSLTLKVAKPPKPFSQLDWLATESLTLSDNFNDNANALKQGTTLERTISLNVKGVPVELLPDIKIADGEGYSVYPEKPVEENVVKNGNLYGNVTLKVNYLLNEAKDITIPEITLPWYNTKIKKRELATLRARRINVVATDPTPDKVQNTKPTKQEVMSSEPILTSAKASEFSWGFGFAALFCALWLLTMFFWWRSSKPQGIFTKRKHIKAIKEACLKAQPLFLKEALIRWARDEFSKHRIINLHDVANAINDPTLSKQIHLLSEHIYSQNKQNKFNGVLFWQAFKGCKRKRRKAHKSNLPPINP